MKYALFGIAIAALLVTVAYSDDEVIKLRARGPAVVDELIANDADDELLDRVCAQKDCRTSRLYWYTDLESAKAAAKKLGRPILALHMLGRLDEELSCANSRFFRTLLYSDDRISAVLRDRYVLFWHSVRPVPQVTIELGDGRVIRQTITGNSAHYLLTADGDVLDALPGLYSPAAFRKQLRLWLDLHREVGTKAGALPQYHAARLNSLNARAGEFGLVQYVRERPASERRPTAEEASKLAMTKSAGESYVLRQLEPGAALRIVPPEQWVNIGEQEMESVVFSPASLALMRKKQPISDELLTNLRRTVATDTVYNEIEFHRQIHQWFLTGEVRDLPSLNERVYRELFLTPSDDPWLGLKEPDVFTAIGG